MHQKRILAGALGCLLICSHPAGYMAAAQIPQIQIAEDSSESAAQAEAGQQLMEQAEQASQQIIRPEDLEPDFNDPDYVKQLYMQENVEEPDQGASMFSLRARSEVTKSPFTGLTYTHAARLSGYGIVHGIDVSKWQADINWKKVKAAGVKFVFIRCGYTSLSDKFAMYEDPYFRQNIQGAYNAGIKVGIYFFTNSKNVNEAQKEAKKTLELIKDYKHMITLPVVYDFEAFSNAYRAYGTPKEQVTKNAFAYMETIEGAGYTPMYYGSPNFLNSSYDVSKLKDYDCWLANYTTQTSYTGDYIYWQYSSSGQVDGIAGNVDCNFYYDAYGMEEPEPQPTDVVTDLGPVSGLQMTDHSSSSITIAWDPVEEADGYRILRSKAYGGSYKELDIIDDSTITEYTDDTVIDSEGRQYFYKVVPYIIEEIQTEPDPGTVTGAGIAEIEPGAGAETIDPGTGAETETVDQNAGADMGSADPSAGTGTGGTNPSTGSTEPGADTQIKETVTKYGVESDILTAYTEREHTFRLKTLTNMNLREHAGTEYPSIAVVPSGTKLPYFKYTLSTEDKKWYKVTYKANGKSYSGYLSGSYVKRYTYGKTTKKVNMRSGAGLGYKISRSVPKGVKVTIAGSKVDAKGTHWSKISYVKNGKSYSGFIPTKYIKQV